MELPQTIIVPLYLIEFGKSKIEFRPFICDLFLSIIRQALWSDVSVEFVFQFCFVCFITKSFLTYSFVLPTPTLSTICKPLSSYTSSMVKGRLCLSNLTVDLRQQPDTIKQISYFIWKWQEIKWHRRGKVLLPMSGVHIPNVHYDRMSQFRTMVLNGPWRVL